MGDLRYGFLGRLMVEMIRTELLGTELVGVGWVVFGKGFSLLMGGSSSGELGIV